MLPDKKIFALVAFSAATVWSACAHDTTTDVGEYQPVPHELMEQVLQSEELIEYEGFLQDSGEQLVYEEAVMLRSPLHTDDFALSIPVVELTTREVGEYAELIFQRHNGDDDVFVVPAAQPPVEADSESDTQPKFGCGPWRWRQAGYGCETNLLCPFQGFRHTFTVQRGTRTCCAFGACWPETRTRKLSLGCGCA